MNPTSLPFEYPFQWDNESLREGAGVTPEGAAILKQRDRDLEDYLSGLGAALAVIDMGDGAVPTGHSKAWYFHTAAMLGTIAGTLAVPGTTATIADVLKNGSVVGTVTIPANATSATADVGVPFAAGDRWQMQVTTAGTGAGALTYYGDLT